jgi:polar amino acid transport system ATP-binding protein
MNVLEQPPATTVASPAAAAAMPVVVQIRDLTKSFDGRVVLDNIDLTIKRREIVSIIGSSGGGKTTLLRCINLLERPDRGRIELLGKSIFEGTRVVCPSLTQLRQSVGMVFQRFHLFPHLTAVENVMLAQMKAAHVSEEEALTTAVRLLKRVRLSHRGLAFPDQMSGGEQQRVAIARALALQPTVLLFDEPTSSLDPEATGEVLQVMRELAADGITMALVTHEIAFAREVSDHVVFVAGGRIVEEGPPSEVIDRPRHERTRGFLTSYLAGRGLSA